RGRVRDLQRRLAEAERVAGRHASEILARLEGMLRWLKNDDREHVSAAASRQTDTGTPPGTCTPRRASSVDSSPSNDMDREIGANDFKVEAEALNSGDGRSPEVETV